MNREDYEILVNSMPPRKDGSPNNPPEYAIRLLEETCKRTGLDWRMRHVYLMQRGGKWGVTLSIDGFRKIGAEDADYAGQEGPFWVATPDSAWTDIPPDSKIYAAKVGIKHRNGTTTWGIAKFSDYKAGPMWDKFPSTMSAKCAEMLAWRKAFPGRLGGLYGLEEMQQADTRGRTSLETTAPSMENDPTKEGQATQATEVVRVSQAEYMDRLSKADSLGRLKEVGRAIARDSNLNPQETLQLHGEYERLKSALSQSK